VQSNEGKKGGKEVSPSRCKKRKQKGTKKETGEIKTGQALKLRKGKTCQKRSPPKKKKDRLRQPTAGSEESPERKEKKRLLWGPGRFNSVAIGKPKSTIGVANCLGPKR